MPESQDPEFTSSYEHSTKLQLLYTATIYENDLKTSRKDFPQ